MNHILCLCLFVTLTMEVIKGSSTEPSHGDTCENIRKQMPSEIKIGSDNSHLHITCSNEEGMVHEFVLEVKCLSDWCANETHKQNFALTEICDGNGQSHKFQLKNELDDSTTYSFRVFADNCEKTYNETAKGGPKTKLTQLSVFCTSKDALGLKWLNPYPQQQNFVSSYKINSGPNNLRSVKPLSCKWWKGYECTILRDFEPGTVSDLVVKTIMNDKNITGPIGIPTVNYTNPNDARYLAHFTIDAWSGNKSLLLKWQILKTCPPKTVNIKLGPTDIFTDDIYIDGNNYAIQLNLTGEKADFDVNVEIEGQWKARAKLTIISSNPSLFTDTFLIEICSKNCSIKIPKLSENQGYGKYYLLVATTDMPNKKVGEILRSTKTGSSEGNFFPMSKDEKRYYSFEVGAIDDTISSNHFIYLVTKDTTDPKVLMKQHVIRAKVWTSSISPMLIIASVASVIIVLVACGLFLMYWFRLRQPNRKIGMNLLNIRDRDSLELMLNEPSVPPSSNQLSRVIKIEALGDYLVESLKGHPNRSLLQEQFTAVPKRLDLPTLQALKPLYAKKNRYSAILPYDKTRVILKDYKEGFDYINANYINGYAEPRVFIAAQAPLKDTVPDFWWMIWQDNIRAIVMLTKLHEGGKEKCAKYWPDFGSSTRFGVISVQNSSVMEFSDYTITELTVQFKNEKRIVRHYHFVSWPDHGVPIHSEILGTFLKKIFTIPETSPILVHCNAGCGRTGTLIFCHIAIKMAQTERQVDFWKILSDLRFQRVFLVTNLQQYIFAHFVVYDFLCKTDFSIPVYNRFQQRVDSFLKHTTVNSLIEEVERNFKFLEKLYSGFTLKLSDEDKAEIDFTTIFTGDHEVLLRSRSEDNLLKGINAIEIDRLCCLRKIVVIQQPQLRDVAEFWSHVLESPIDTIVSLNKIDKEDCGLPLFWKWDEVSAVLNKKSIAIKFLDEDDKIIYSSVRIEVTCDSNSRVIKIINVKTWAREEFTPSNTSDLLNVWQESFKDNEDQSDILVTCYDGSTASGLFIALDALLKKLSLEHVCDVYTAANLAKQHRRAFITEWAQYEFLYKAAVEYVKNFDPEFKDDRSQNDESSKHIYSNC